MEQHTPLLHYRISSFVIGVYCVDCVYGVDCVYRAYSVYSVNGVPRLSRL